MKPQRQRAPREAIFLLCVRTKQNHCKEGAKEENITISSEKITQYSAISNKLLIFASQKYYMQ